MNRQTQSLGISGSLRRGLTTAQRCVRPRDSRPKGRSFASRSCVSRIGPRWKLTARARSTSPHDSEASIIFGKGVTSKPGSAHILVLAVDLATLADLLHETAEHYDHYEKTHAQHNWWNWYEQVTILEVSYGGDGAVAVSTARK